MDKARKGGSVEGAACRGVPALIRSGEINARILHGLPGRSGLFAGRIRRSVAVRYGAVLPGLNFGGLGRPGRWSCSSKQTSKQAKVPMLGGFF